MVPNSTSSVTDVGICVLVMAALLYATDARAGADPQPQFTKVILNEHFWSEGATFADIDRDGIDDVVAGPFWYAGPDFKRRHEIYRPAASFERIGSDRRRERVPGFEGALGSKNTYSDNFFAFTYDFDADGCTDVLFFGFPGEAAFWMRNPAGETRHWARHTVLEQLGNESPTFTDLDGDGRPEIVGMSQGYLGYAPIGEDPTKLWQFRRISGDEGRETFTHGLGVGDVNGDGRMDVIEAKGWREQPASLAGDPVWKRHRAPFDAGPPDPSGEFPTFDGAQFHVYDVNGDDVPDVVGSINAHGYGLAWYEQVRSGGDISFRRHLILNTSAAKNAQGVQFSQLHAVDVADIDGDGLKDIVTGKRVLAHGWDDDPDSRGPAVLYWFKLVRDGKHAEFVPKLIDADSGVGTQVVAQDANGDGRPDIVVANKKGTFVHIQRARTAQGEVETKEPTRSRDGTDFLRARTGAGPYLGRAAVGVENSSRGYSQRGKSRGGQSQKGKVTFAASSIWQRP